MKSLAHKQYSTNKSTTQHINLKLLTRALGPLIGFFATGGFDGRGTVSNPAAGLKPDLFCGKTGPFAGLFGGAGGLAGGPGSFLAGGGGRTSLQNERYDTVHIGK